MLPPVSPKQIWMQVTKPGYGPSKLGQPPKMLGKPMVNRWNMKRTLYPHKRAISKPDPSTLLLPPTSLHMGAVPQQQLGLLNDFFVSSCNHLKLFGFWWVQIFPRKFRVVATGDLRNQQSWLPSSLKVIAFIQAVIQVLSSLSHIILHLFLACLYTTSGQCWTKGGGSELLWRKQMIGKSFKILQLQSPTNLLIQCRQKASVQLNLYGYSFQSWLEFIIPIEGKAIYNQKHLQQNQPGSYTFI